MTRTHQLETTLRSLKLSGMLDTLESRLAQAHAGELGHVEFLQSLCEDELSRRDAAGIVRRVRAARFEQLCAMEDFDFNFNPLIPAALIRDLATLRFVESSESVILHGPVGVGKTMTAANCPRPAHWGVWKISCQREAVRRRSGLSKHRSMEC